MIPHTYAERSYTGRRDQNEDTSTYLRLDKEVLFWGVADGMGGYAGGNLASQLVDETCRAFLIEKVETGEGAINLRSILQEMYARCQDVLRAKKEADSRLERMGTTLVCALLQGERCVIANVGDSRAYLYRKGKVLQITVDHTLLEDYRQKGHEPDSSMKEQYGHVINRCLDGKTDKPDLYPASTYAILTEGDVLLLCSDGLLVEDDEHVTRDIIREQLVGTPDLQSAVDGLISWAYQNGSTDNITVAAVEFGSLKRSRTPAVTYPFPPPGAAEEMDGRDGPEKEEPFIDHSVSEGLEQPRPKAKKRRTPRLLLFLLFLVLGGMGSLYYIHFVQKDGGWGFLSGFTADVPSAPGPEADLDPSSPASPDETIPPEAPAALATDPLPEGAVIGNGTDGSEKEGKEPPQGGAPSPDKPADATTKPEADAAELLSEYEGNQAEIESEYPTADPADNADDPSPRPEVPVAEQPAPVGSEGAGDFESVCPVEKLVPFFSELEYQTGVMEVELPGDLSACVNSVEIKFLDANGDSQGSIWLQNKTLDLSGMQPGDYQLELKPVDGNGMPIGESLALGSPITLSE